MLPPSRLLALCPSNGYDACVKTIIAKHETTIASLNRNSEGC
jgi:hypothetical protein